MKNAGSVFGKVKVWVSVGDGNTARFWSSNWINGSMAKSIALCYLKRQEERKLQYDRR
jgi:hypothetical protein